MQDRLFRHEKVRVVWDSAVDEVLGGDGPMAGVEAVRVRNLKSGETSDIPADGLFVAIGHDPATTVFRGQMPIDEEGYLLASANSTKTQIAGVFAAGDCVDKVFRQAVTAAGMGCMAALEAEKFIAEAEDAARQAAE